MFLGVRAFSSQVAAHASQKADDRSVVVVALALGRDLHVGEAGAALIQDAHEHSCLIPGLLAHSPSAREKNNIYIAWE